jgi:hypothetical protein
MLAAAVLHAQEQVPAIHDTTSPDSIRFDLPPLPGGAAAVFRFLFSEVPQWIQISGVIVGAIVAIVLLTIIWQRRSEIIHWLVTRSRGAKFALGASVVLALGIAGAAGAWSWNFMMHENDFCSSCHVMKSAFGRFQVSEHDKLECHACHQQSIFASTKELYYWVLDRPEKIPEHAPVPNRVCGECHLQQQADSTWKRIIATAGHQVHFKSDSTALRDLMCVDCHAKEVHAFKPVDVSCTTSGCHETIEIQLGEMANQSGLHCVTCHEFARPVSELISVDSTTRSLVPARQECFTCHEMREKLENRGLDKDPHEANCGTCHNPHDQTKAGKAFETCATAGCHANPDTLTAFHRGLGRHALDDCGACHKPHSWVVESKRCIDCHADIFRDRPPPRLRPRATETGAMLLPHSPPGTGSPRRVGGPHVSEGDDEAADPGVEPVRWARPPPQGRPVQRNDTTFSHNRHRKVACESCHSSASVHGAVTIRAPEGCQGCHHAADARAGKCATCHEPAELEAPYPMTVTMRITGRAAPITRSLPYVHPQHQRLECATCHGAGIEQRLTRTCADCHSDHHRADATCTTCHEDSRKAHARDSHLGCATCHTASFAASLPASRQVCLSCHREQVTHKPGQECAPCHRATWDARAGSA